MNTNKKDKKEAKKSGRSWENGPMENVER